MTFSFPEACRILSQEEYASRLRLAGWTRVPCRECEGVGHFVSEDKNAELFGGMAKAVSRRMCNACHGEGEVWQEPATK